jgi:hypothetical protein
MSLSKGIIVNGVELQFISLKKNVYDVEYYYFRIVSKDLEKRLKPYFKVSETLVSPIFRSDDNEKCFIKVKSSCVPITSFTKASVYSCDINFVAYGCFDNKPPTGYYAALMNVKALAEIGENDSD